MQKKIDDEEAAIEAARLAELKRIVIVHIIIIQILCIFIS